MVFKPQKDLKEPKYKKLEIWNQGWETIDIGTPPTGNAVIKEIHQIQDEYRTATDEQKQQYINCDLDASYYIKLYMEDHDLPYAEDEIEYIEKQCKPIIRHYKNFYNRPRPYQVAEALDIDFDALLGEEQESEETPAWIVRARNREKEKRLALAREANEKGGGYVIVDSSNSGNQNAKVDNNYYPDQKAYMTNMGFVSYNSDLVKQGN